jgi:hypothetical protein
MQLSEFRHRDVQRVYEMVLPRGGETPRPLIIQGLPGCGVEEVFTELSRGLSTEWAQPENRILTVKNLSTFWVKPVSLLVHSLCESIKGPVAFEKNEVVEENLETELANLRTAVLRHAEQGGQVVFMLDNFDALPKFSEPAQVQALLNILQSLGYEYQYHTAFVVRCYRDIEDICQATNYSDFYKIFGTNHYRVSRVTDQQIQDFVRLKSPELDPQYIDKLVALSAGYPEHAELLLRYEGSAEQICSQAVDAMASVFEEWLSCLSADEQQILHLISIGQKLGYEHLFAQRKLLRKGIVTEVSQLTKISSPLFETHLTARVGKIHGEQTPCIRKSSFLSDVHRSLLEQLFQGRYLIEWHLLQSPKPGDATVYLISGEDQQGASYRPCIVKIHRSDMIDRELIRTEKARELLGPVVPSVLGQASLKGQKAVMFEYATADNRSYDVRQFAEFFRSERTEQVASLLRKLFGQALWPFYQSQIFKERSASRLYFLPRLDRGEFDKIDHIVHHSHFYDSNRDGLILPGQKEFLVNPASILRPVKDDPCCAYHELFLEKRNACLCLVHGDVNPRNFLVDGIGNIHIIDFAAMKEEGGRFLDMTRLEAEIKFKLVDVGPTVDEMVSFVVVERFLAGACDDTALEMALHLPFLEQVAKMVAAVVALRQTARSICREEIDNEDFELEYKTALLAQTLRLSLYEGYLSNQQQELAVVSAAMLTDRLLNLIRL